MSTKLVAKFLYAGTDDNVLMVGFADDEYDPQESILFTWSPEVDEQDLRLGHDQVYISTGDQSKGTYGGVTRVVLRNGSATLVLTPKTAQRLKTEPCIEVEFPRDSDYLHTAREYLQQMFGSGRGAFEFAEEPGPSVGQ